MKQTELGAHHKTVKSSLIGLIVGDIGCWFGVVCGGIAIYSVYATLMALMGKENFDIGASATMLVIFGLIAILLVRRTLKIWKNTRFEFCDNGFIYYHKKTPYITANSEIVEVDQGYSSTGGIAVWAKTINEENGVWVKKGHFENDLIDWLFDAHQRGTVDVISNTIVTLTRGQTHKLETGYILQIGKARLYFTNHL